jgi:PAS domain S-box-containing protein
VRLAAWHRVNASPPVDPAVRSAGTPGPPPSVALATLDAVLDATNDAVLVLDPGDRIASWNRGAERLFGYLPDEVLDGRAVTLFPAHLRPELERMLQAVLQAGHRISQFETEIRRKDGMPAPVALSLTPLPSETGRQTAVAVLHDITEQRLAQARLAEVEAQMREAEALAHVGSWLWDVRTGAVQWSDGFHRIHRLDPLEFGGTVDAHVQRAHPDDRARLRRSLTEAVASARPCDLEYRVVRPARGGGAPEVGWVHVRAEPTLDSAGAVVGLRGIGQDVTQRHA